MSRRTREIGVRLALGAQRVDVLRLLLQQGAAATAAGAIAGTIAAALLMRLIASMLYDIAPSDPVTFAIAPLLLFAVALAASAIPAVRASRLDPASVLKAE
jgi:putative ABC transport system permease protein